MGMHCATTFVTNRQRCPPTEIIQSGRATPARTLDSPVLFPTFLITGREVQDRWTAGFRDVTLGSLPIFQLCSLLLLHHFPIIPYSVLSFCLVLLYIPSAFYYIRYQDIYCGVSSHRAAGRRHEKSALQRYRTYEEVTRP